MGRMSRQASKAESLDSGTVEVKHEFPGEAALTEDPSSTRVEDLKEEDATSDIPTSTISFVQPLIKPCRSSTASTPDPHAYESGHVREDVDNVYSSESSVKNETPVPKKGRAATQKAPPRIAPLFDDLPDATEEAERTFTVIDSCIYQNKYLGYSEHALECDCTEEWGGSLF